MSRGHSRVAEYREWIIGAALLVSCAPALQASAPQRLVRCLVHPSRQLSTQQLAEETHENPVVRPTPAAALRLTRPNPWKSGKMLELS